ncbi:MAG: hypothetical protein L0Y56_08455, partial [Nitrospira sp.]|nr:hypothetical protein [Nitrospira sp.]
MQPIFAYRLSDYLDQLPLYNSPTQENILALARKIVDSQDYVFRAYGFPDGRGLVAGVSANIFTPRQTQEGSLLVEPMS